MAINSYRASGQNQYGVMTDLDKRGAQINDANFQRKSQVADQDWMLQNMLRQEAANKQQNDRSFTENARQFDTQTANQTGQFDKSFAQQGQHFDKDFAQRGEQFNINNAQQDRRYNEDVRRYDNDPVLAKGRWMNDQLGVTGTGGWNPTVEMGQREKFAMLTGGQAPVDHLQALAEGHIRDLLSRAAGNQEAVNKIYAAAEAGYRTHDWSPVFNIKTPETRDETMAKPAIQDAIESARLGAETAVIDLARSGGNPVETAGTLVSGLVAKVLSSGQQGKDEHIIRKNVAKDLADAAMAMANRPGANPREKKAAMDLARALSDAQYHYQTP
jgi:hypothetical protein